MNALRPLDYFQIAVTALMSLLGVTIIVRASARGAPLASYVVGAAFLGYGIYRAHLILVAMRARRAAR